MSAHQQRSLSQYNQTSQSQATSPSFAPAQGMGNAAMQDMLNARLAQTSSNQTATPSSEKEKPKWTLDDLLALTAKIAPNAFQQANDALGYDPEVSLSSRGTLRGYYNQATKKRRAYITISPKLSLEEAAQVLVVELGNAARQQAYEAIDQQAATGSMNREDYTKEIERVEFGARADSLAAYERGFENGDLKGPSLFTPGVDFETYYAHENTQQHADMYRNQWDTNYDPIYSKLEDEKARAIQQQERTDRKSARQTKKTENRERRVEKRTNRKAARRTKKKENREHRVQQRADRQAARQIKADAKGPRA